jgi:hypothetical protein
MRHSALVSWSWTHPLGVKPFAKGVGGFDDTLVGEPVGLHAVVGAFLAKERDGDRDEPDHVPVSHEPFQVHPAIHGLQRGQAIGSTAAQYGNAKRSDQSTQPTQ